VVLETVWVLLVQPMVSAAKMAAQTDIGFFCMGAKVLFSGGFCNTKFSKKTNKLCQLFQTRISGKWRIENGERRMKEESQKAKVKTKNFFKYPYGF
jgi:hypothetical protein